MILRIVLLLSFLTILSGCKSSEDYFSEGLDLSAAGDFKSALFVFREAIEANPFHKDAYIQLGICHENLNEHDSAISVYTRLLNLYPENTAACYYCGICKYRQHKYQDAITYYNRALDSKGGFNVTDTNSIQALLDMNKDNFESELPEFDIPFREILYDRAMAYFKAGQMKKASVDFTNCIQQEYNSGTSYYMIKRCHLAKKENKNVRGAFTRAPLPGSRLTTKKLPVI